MISPPPEGKKERSSRNVVVMIIIVRAFVNSWTYISPAVHHLCVRVVSTINITQRMHSSVAYVMHARYAHCRVCCIGTSPLLHSRAYTFLLPPHVWCSRCCVTSSIKRPCPPVTKVSRLLRATREFDDSYTRFFERPRLYMYTYFSTMNVDHTRLLNKVSI